MKPAMQYIPVMVHIGICEVKDAEIEQLKDKITDLEEAHQRIVEWVEAYPLKVFPEPDLNKARQLLEAGGMTLDAISADAMRHVITQVGKISMDALKIESQGPGNEIGWLAAGLRWKLGKGQT